MPVCVLKMFSVHVGDKKKVSVEKLKQQKSGTIWAPFGILTRYMSIVTLLCSLIVIVRSTRLNDFHGAYKTHKKQCTLVICVDCLAY